MAAPLPPRDESFEAYLTRRAREVDAALERFVPPESERPETVHRAMRYSLLGGGKRVRPVLVLAAGEALGARAPDLMPAACVVEMIHTYSLIHDDLPAMDDDDMRRGRPSCHKAFGEAVAILAGDALLTRAFEVLATGALACGPERQLRAVYELASGAGTSSGIIGGQVVDIESEGRAVDADVVDYIHRCKTGALIRASVVMGAIVAGGTDAQVAALRAYGERIGLAFQIADDILDITVSSEALGKTAGKDVAVGKATYPAVHGLAAAQARATQLVDEAVAIVEQLGVEHRVLASIARFIVARQS
jgi:geranylgeranyl diphosphate synthase type II